MDGEGLRIVMVGPFGLQPKGTMAVRALPLAQALAARGHVVKIVMPAWHTPQERARVWSQRNVELEYVALGPLSGHASAPWIVRRLVRAALAWQPDLLHCFKPKAYAGWAAWWLWQRRRLDRSLPALVVDEDDWEGRGGWEAREDYTGAQRLFFRWQERWGLTHCDAVTVASQALQTLVWSLGVPTGRVTYLPNGSMLSPLPDEPQSESDTVLLYTRLAEFDPGRAVATFEKLLQAVPRARLRVVGQGLHKQADAALSQAISASGVADSVERMGWLSPEALPQALSSCAVALYPLDDDLVNRCKCPVKLADLVALGVPVVADDVGEARRYVRDGQSGYLVPAGDMSAMAERASQLLADPALARRMGAAARQHAATHFDWHRLAIMAEGVYYQAVNSRNRA